LGERNLKKRTWRKDLHEYIDSLKNHSFSVGEYDCYSFIVQCLDAMLKRDVQGKYIGEYETQEEAELILVENGGYFGVAQKLLEVDLGLEESDPNYLKKGDPVVITVPKRELGFGINLAGGIGIPSLDQGIQKVRREHVEAGWNVPCQA
jgi:hypothetical protein